MIFLVFKWLVIGFLVAFFLFYLFCIFMMGDLTNGEHPEGYEENCKRFLTLVRRNRGEDNGF